MLRSNCAAIPETLIESELFGHEKGAFTGATAKRAGLIEAAEGGTLFLDEIGELPSEAQARLLRFLQESEIRRVGSNESRKVDVRLVFATHRDLQEMAKTGLFRPDLYYRINVFRIFLPPLCQRGSDLLDMAEHLLDRTANKYWQTGPVSPARRDPGHDQLRLARQYPRTGKRRSSVLRSWPTAALSIAICSKSIWNW